MANKLQLAERIKRLYYGQDLSKDHQLDDRELFPLISEAYAEIVEMDYKIRRGNEGDGEKMASSTFIKAYEDVPVKCDKKKELYYIDIPAKFILLPHDKGVFQVSYMAGQDKPFTPVRIGSLAMFDGLEADIYSNDVEYWIQGDKIFFKNIIKDSEVLVLLYPTLEGYDEEEEIPIPEERLLGVIERILGLVGPGQAQPQDNTNDNNKEA